MCGSCNHYFILYKYFYTVLLYILGLIPIPAVLGTRVCTVCHREICDSKSLNNPDLFICQLQNDGKSQIPRRYWRYTI